MAFPPLMTCVVFIGDIILDMSTSDRISFSNEQLETLAYDYQRDPTLDWWVSTLDSGDEGEEVPFGITREHVDVFLKEVGINFCSRCGRDVYLSIYGFCYRCIEIDE